jgi:hypothetical protein
MARRSGAPAMSMPEPLLPRVLRLTTRLVDVMVVALIFSVLA